MLWEKLFGGREWGRLLEARRGRLWRMACAWAKDPVLAEDLVQETLLRALRFKDQLRDPERLDAWLFRILHNCWQDHLRHQARAGRVEAPEVAEVQPPEALCRQSETVVRVREAVASLPDGQRQVLTLVDLEGLSYAEVSEVLGIPMGTVMSRLSRARGNLRERLRNFHGEPAQEERKAHLRRVK